MELPVTVVPVIYNTCESDASSVIDVVPHIVPDTTKSPSIVSVVDADVQVNALVVSKYPNVVVPTQ